MQLVIANIGVHICAISRALFSMVVVMAHVTTFMRTPLLEWIYPMHMIRGKKTKLAHPEAVAYEPFEGSLNSGSTGTPTCTGF